MSSGHHRRDAVQKAAAPAFAHPARLRRRARYGRRPVWDGSPAATVAVVVLLVLVVVLGIVVLRSNLPGRTEALPWQGDCIGGEITATVAAAPDHAEVLRQIATDWTDRGPIVAGRCARVQVVTRPSAQVAGALGSTSAAAAQIGKPAVWAPESTVWSALAATRPEGAALLPAGGPSLAVTPVVIAVPKDRAGALGWPSPQLGWRSILGGLRANPTWGRYGHPEWGRFVLGMSDPTTSTAGLHTLLALTDSNHDGLVEDDEVANELLLERSVGRYGADTDDLLQSVGTGTAGGALSAFPATEQAVLRYDQGTSGTPLVSVYPPEAVPDADHPFLLLRAPWVSAQQRAVASAFLDYALGAAGREAYARAGFRDRDRSAQQIPGTLLDTATLQRTYPTRPLLAAGPTGQVLVRWRALRYPANVIAAIDTSGSMAAAAPGLPVSKLAVLQRAAVQAVRLFNLRSSLGLWEFSSKLDGDADYRTLVPARPLGSPVGTGTQRDAVTAAVGGLRPRGATGLYDTIEAGYVEMHRIWRPDQQNILVVMTDGRNEDSKGLSLPQLVGKLSAERDASRPVTTIFIAYGADADVGELNVAAKATGGRTYYARNPADIGRVFLAAMVNR